MANGMGFLGGSALAKIMGNPFFIFQFYTHILLSSVVLQELTVNKDKEPDL